MEIAPGLAGSATCVVSDSDTAIAHRSGDVPVLSTPRLVALCEEAACAALEGCLAPDTTSVGTHVEIDHIAPSPPGATVLARAEVERVEGRKVNFMVSASDGKGAVASGRIVRALVHRESFLSKLSV